MTDQTRTGRNGLVLQMHDTRVLHLYGEKWFGTLPIPPRRVNDV